MIIHGIETGPDGDDKCGLLSNHTGHSNLAESPSSRFPLAQSDRTQSPALNLWQ